MNRISKQPSPPKGAIRFIQWRLGNNAEDLIGDLHEIYFREIREKSVWLAGIFFWSRATWLVFSKTGRYRKKMNRQRRGLQMQLYASYLKTAFRSIIKNRFFSAVNVAGLALGMCTGLIVISLITELLKFDEFHVKKDSIYRVITKAAYYQSDWAERATTCEPVAGLLKQTSGVQKVVRVQKRLNGDVDTGLKILPLSGYFADEDFFNVFSFEFISGDADKSLSNPFQIVLTESSALKLFNHLQVIDSVLKIGNLGFYTVTGLIRDVPKASHLQFDMVASFSTVPLLERDGKLSGKEGDWSDVNGTYVYGLLEPGTSVSAIQKILNNKASGVYQNYDYVDATFSLQSLKKIVPGKDISNAIGPKMVDIAIYIMSGLAFLILLSATFNYTHLSAARMLQKSREIGLRKVIGGTRLELFIQLLTETVIVSLLALILAICLFILIRPHFLSIIPRASEMLDMQITPELLFYFIGFSLFVGILAGTFPALLFAKLSPVHALKNSTEKGKRFTLTKGLVVGQFALSLIFILGVFIIFKQYRFSLNYDVGFRHDNLITFPINGTNRELMVGEFQKISDVESIAMSSLIPGTGSNQSLWVKTTGSADSLVGFFMSVDENFLPTLELRLMAGRNFHSGIEESNALLISEKLSRALGFQRFPDALDKSVLIHGREFRIIGVIKDFHYMHLEEPVKNFFIIRDPDQFRYAFVKINSRNIQSAIPTLEKAWQTVAPSRQFHATFLDDQLENAYSHYLNVMKIFGYLGSLAVVIACLGLLGMAVYTTKLRMKEVGIRKVMGASGISVMRLLSGNFLILMAIAVAIGVPMAYLLFNLVLLPLNYYHAQVGWTEIFFGVSLMILLGFLTIGSQTLKAATTNPVDVLRND